VTEIAGKGQVKNIRVKENANEEMTSKGSSSKENIGNGQLK
jgi:hypothetical protein